MPLSPSVCTSHQLGRATPYIWDSNEPNNKRASRLAQVPIRSIYSLRWIKPRRLNGLLFRASRITNILCRMPLSIFTAYTLLLGQQANLPTHHCRTAMRTTPVVPVASRSYLPFPHPRKIARRRTRGRGKGVFSLRWSLAPATVHAIDGSPTSCQVVLQSFQRQLRCYSGIFLQMSTVVVRGIREALHYCSFHYC